MIVYKIIDTKTRFFFNITWYSDKSRPVLFIFCLYSVMGADSNVFGHKQQCAKGGKQRERRQPPKEVRPKTKGACLHCDQRCLQTCVFAKLFFKGSIPYRGR